jgi:hypothetical protein
MDEQPVKTRKEQLKERRERIAIMILSGMIASAYGSIPVQSSVQWALKWADELITQLDADD